VAPTGVQIAERAIQAWNRGETERLLALCDDEVRPAVAKLAAGERHRLEPIEYRTVGDSVVVTLPAGARQCTLVLTVRKSLVRAIEQYAPGDALPERLRP